MYLLNDTGDMNKPFKIVWSRLSYNLWIESLALNSTVYFKIKTRENPLLKLNIALAIYLVSL